MPMFTGETTSETFRWRQADVDALGVTTGVKKFRLLYMSNLPIMLFDIDLKSVYPMVFFKMLTGFPSGISKNLDRVAGLE